MLGTAKERAGFHSICVWRKERDVVNARPVRRLTVNAVSEVVRRDVSAIFGVSRQFNAIGPNAVIDSVHAADTPSPRSGLRPSSREGCTS